MECPYCLEEVKEAAVVCSHCGRDLSAFKLIAPTLEKVSDFEKRLSSLEKQLVKSQKFCSFLQEETSLIAS